MLQAVSERLGYSTLAALLATAAAGLLLALCTAASPAWASSSCPNEALRTGPGANLPDCRAYELVSPPNKNGGSVEGGVTFEALPPPEQAAADGEAITYGSQTTFTEADPESSILTTQYLSVRGPDGWSTRAITPRQSLPYGEIDKSSGAEDWDLFQGFSENLETGFLLSEDPPLVAGAPLGYYNPYLQDESDGGYTLLSTVKPAQEPGYADETNGAFLVHYAGMSADGSHVIFEANEALTPEAVPGRDNLYEWADGRLELVSVLPNGEADFTRTAGRVAEKYGLEFGGPPTQGDPARTDEESYNRAISLNGTRVFWTSSNTSEETGARQVYMHEITTAGARTVEVSASQKTNGSGPGGGDPNSPLPPHYWTASADGSLVYFTSCQQLTNDSTAKVSRPQPGAPEWEECRDRNSSGPDGNQGQDLYQYDANTGVLTDITVDRNAGETADVKGVLGTSEDGSYVYFAATGKLAEGAIPESENANPESINLYLWHDGTTTFIASLGGERDTGTSYSEEHPEEASDWDEADQQQSSRISPDGQFLAFESTRPLTGYDNVASTPACEENQLDEDRYYHDVEDRCFEVYEYDAATGRLSCASCNPSGVPPVGESVVPETLSSGDRARGWQTPTVQQRYLVDDGQLFFTSKDALLPQASDGQQNVYEYDPDAVGSCRSAQGCINLISSGTSSGPSWFVDASADGANAFFTTNQSLLPQDGDDVYDMYDARVDGGFAATVAPPCGGEACRPPVTPAPAIYGAPPSATFVGAGNPAVQLPAVESKTKKAPGRKPGSKKKKKKKTGGRKSTVGSGRTVRSGKRGGR
jgi:hypothetical protein